MKITHNTSTNITISIIADKETLTKIKQATLKKHNTPSLKVPGFRAGKAPLNMVEKHIDQSLLQSDFIDAVLNHYYVSAITTEKLRTVGQPQVNLSKFVPFTTMEFDVSVDILGDVVLPDYKKLKQAKTLAKVEIKDVNEVIASLQKRLADKKSVNRAAKNGDEVIVDFKGTDAKGEAINGAEGQDYPLLLGSNTFIPGFEPNIVGMKTGDKKKFTIPFPKDYSVAVLQGKKVTFEVTVKTINELIEPKADDNFAAKAGPFSTLKALKADIKEQLTIEKQRELDRIYENELLEKIVAKTKVDVPATLIDEQVARLEQEERQNLAYKGQTWQEHLDEEAITEEAHRERNKPEAEKQIKIGVMLGAIGDKEGIDVTPEETDVRLQLLKGQYTDKAMQDELDKPGARQDIESRLRTEKIIAKLTSYALA